jgi:hypothetical protein
MSMYHALGKRFAYKIIAGKPGRDKDTDERIILKQATKIMLNG